MKKHKYPDGPGFWWFKTFGAWGDWAPVLVIKDEEDGSLHGNLLYYEPESTMERTVKNTLVDAWGPRCVMPLQEWPWKCCHCDSMNPHEYKTCLTCGVNR